MWTTIFKEAAGISTSLAAVCFIAALFVWLASQKREHSIVTTIEGEGVLNPGDVLRILKQFKSDETRLKALEATFGYDHNRAAGVLAKVKPTIDVGKFSLSTQVQTYHSLVVVGIVLIVLAALSVFGSTMTVAKPRQSNTCAPVSPAENDVIAAKQAVDSIARDFEAIPNSGDVVRAGVIDWAPKRAKELLRIHDDEIGACFKIGKYQSAAHAYMMGASASRNPQTKIDFAEKSIENCNEAKKLLRDLEASPDPSLRDVLNRLAADNTEPRVDYLLAMDYCIKAKEEHNPMWKKTVRQILDSIPTPYKEATPPERNSELRACM